MLQNVGDFGLNFLNLTHLIKNPRSATPANAKRIYLVIIVEVNE